MNLTLRRNGHVPKTKSKGRELVYWHNAPGRRRLAWLPLDECARLPREARAAHDNADLKRRVTVQGGALGGALGAVLGLMLAVLDHGLTLSSQDVLSMVFLAIALGTLGIIVAKNLVYPQVAVKPRYMIRANREGKTVKTDAGDVAVYTWRTTPLTIDARENQEWQFYLSDLRERLRRELEAHGDKGEKADALIPGPIITGTPIARYDAYSMYHIEEMKDEQRLAQGWDAKEDFGAILKLGGMMAIAIVGVIVLALVLRDENKKEAAETATLLFQTLSAWWG